MLLLFTFVDVSSGSLLCVTTDDSSFIVLLPPPSTKKNTPQGNLYQEAVTLKIGWVGRIIGLQRSDLSVFLEKPGDSKGG